MEDVLLSKKISFEKNLYSRVDVVIMTKLDKDNFIKEEQLPIILMMHMLRCVWFQQYIRIFGCFIGWDESKIIQLF
jgi:hypothetical protein